MKQFMDKKFRAWDKKDKRMIFDQQDFIPLLVSSVGVFRLNPTCNTNFYSIVEKERIELMQFSGLQDSLGIDIYEGDIVHVSGFGKHEVNFPFCRLYKAKKGGYLGKIVGCIYRSKKS